MGGLIQGTQVLNIQITSYGLHNITISQGLQDFSSLGDLFGLVEEGDALVLLLTHSDNIGLFLLVSLDVLLGIIEEGGDVLVDVLDDLMQEPGVKLHSLLRILRLSLHFDH